MSLFATNPLSSSATNQTLVFSQRASSDWAAESLAVAEWSEKVEVAILLDRCVLGNVSRMRLASQRLPTENI